MDKPFIYVFDKETKQLFANAGFVLMKENGDISIFSSSDSVVFDFSSIDKNKFMISDIMTF